MKYFLIFYFFQCFTTNQSNCVFKKRRTDYIKNFPKRKKINKIKKKSLHALKIHRIVEREKNILKKKWCGSVYTVKNDHGIFTVCVQNHLNYDEIGLASYYDWGELTATGEKFSKKNYTAAHPYLPIPCIALVTCINNPRKKIIVKINDRGPFTKRAGLLIDLTTKGANILGFRKDGLAKVRIKVLKAKTKELVEHGGNFNWDGTLPYFIAKQKHLVLQLRRKKFLNFIRYNNRNFKSRLVSTKMCSHTNKKKKKSSLKNRVLLNEQLKKIKNNYYLKEM